MTEQTITQPTPADLGFAFPAEWAKHARTLMGWPFDESYWEGYLDAARDDFTRLVSTIARFEPVLLAVADDEAEADAKRRLETEQGLKNITFHRLTLDDVWFRDIAPLFVRNKTGEVAATDWHFNGWGNKFRWRNDTQVAEVIAERLELPHFKVPIVMEGGALEINSEGVCLTTRQCLLNQNRNPNLSETEIEGYLKAYLGVKHVIWLNEGLEGDKTDGHIDTITRFANDGIIVTSICEDEADTNYAPLQENLALLRTVRRPNGEPYALVELPLPKKRIDFDDERLPLTYANFYVGNGFVVVPTYDDVNDARALDILKGAFLGREVIGLPSLGLITGGGSFHCVTQQQPAGQQPIVHPTGEAYRG